MKKNIMILVTVCVTAIICGADEKIDTQKILRRTIDQGVQILKNQNSSDDQKLEAFDKLLAESCHTDLMAMLAIGKKGWVALKPDQRKRFISAFLSVITRSYYTKLDQSDVSNVAVDYKENIQTGRNKRALKAVMKNSGEGFNVDYKFALRNGKWAIYDLDVEGISLIASYRSQFTDFLKTKSAAELLAELQSDSEKFAEAAVVE